MKTVPGGNAGELPIFQEAAQLFFPFFFISWKANKSIVQPCNNSTGNSGKNLVGSRSRNSKKVTNCAE